MVGHVGDGNFHALVMIDMNNAEEVEKAKQFNAALVEFGLQRNGTCTGEHGVGIGKMQYQEKEHGAALDVMKTIKLALDPKNILNPGKIVNIEK